MAPEFSAYALTYRYDKTGNRTERTRDGATTVWTINAANQLLAIRQAGVPTQVNIPVKGTTDDPNATVTVNGVTASRDQATQTWAATLSLPEGDHTLRVSAKDPLRNERVVTVPITVIDPTKRAFTSDLNGNLTEELVVGTGDRTTSTYDSLNRLTQVRLPAGATVSFTYDGEGKRVSVTEGGTTTTSIYDGLLPLIERQGGTTTRNLWGLSYGGGIGGLLSRTTASGTLFPLYDGSGNILAWTNQQGAIVSSTVSTAFGEIIAQSGPAQPVGFSTKPFNSATSLSYFGARYYRPDLARWLTPDPLGMVDGPNVYLYVQNNPINWIDPYGYAAIGIIVGGTGEAGAGETGGAAGTGSAGVGIFGGNQGVSLGGFVSSGAFASGPSLTSTQQAAGVFGGVGVGVFISNAQTAEALNNTISTLSIDLGYVISGSLQISWGKGIWVVSITGGPGAGAGTSTVTTQTRGRTILGTRTGKRR